MNKLIFLLISYFSFIIIRNINANDSTKSQIQSLTIADFFPSFTQLDSFIDPISGLSIQCPENCYLCFESSSCESCIYPFILNSMNKCISCPSDCEEGCFFAYKYLSQQQLSFYLNPFCVPNQKSYYLIDDNYYHCSPNCLHCLSYYECTSCISDIFVLVFNNLNNYTCIQCTQIISSCVKCQISHIENGENLSYERMKLFKTISDFESNLWKYYCIECKNSILPLDNERCIPCSEIFPGCTECENKYDDYDDFIRIKCTECEKDLVPFIDPDQNIICKSCSEMIPNCKKCQYGILEDGKAIPVHKLYMYKENYILNPDYKMRCFNCDALFGFANPEQLECTPCPANCEYCYLNLDNNLICGRCNSNYVLNIYEGLCYPYSEYNNITDIQKNECLKIVSENPWSDKILNSNVFLCQECTDSSKYPSVTGRCESCLYSTCSLCNEQEYTDILINNPLLLIEMIQSEINISTIQICLECKNSNFLYDNNIQTCCLPTTIIDKNVFIEGCNTCETCEIVNNVPICNKCFECDNLDLIKDDSEINGASYDSPLYSKKIYLILKNQGPSLNVLPILNETDKYIELYNNLKFQKNIHCPKNLIPKCITCPINSDECLPIVSTFRKQDYQNYFIKFNSIEKNFYQILKYLFVRAETCRKFFIYDYKFGRCKFCPNGWKNCESYKTIEIDFNKNLTKITNKLTVNNIMDLYNMLNELYTSEFIFVANEFMLKRLEIIINIDEEVNFTSDTNLIFKGLLNTVIDNFKIHKITFQPKNYDINPAKKSIINLGCYLSFSDYSEVNFINIILRSCSYLYSVDYILEIINKNDLREMISPGLAFYCITNIIGCSLYKENSKIKYWNGELRVDDLLPVPRRSYYCYILTGCSVKLISFEFFNKTLIKDFEIKDFNTIPFYIEAVKIFKVKALFYFASDEEHKIINFSIVNGNFSNGVNLIYSESSTFFIDNVYVNNSLFNQTNFINQRYKSVILKNFTLLNSIINQSLIIFSDSENFVIYNIIFRNLNFRNSEKLPKNFAFNFKIVNITNFFITKCVFLYSQVIYFPYYTNILNYDLNINGLIMTSNFFHTIDDSLPLIIIIEYTSWTNNFFNFSNVTFIDNKVDSLITWNNSKYYVFKLINVYQFAINNIIFENNIGFSGIYAEFITNFEITKFTYINKELFDIFITPLILSEIQGIIRLANFFFENIVANDLIKINNQLIRNLDNLSFSFLNCFLNKITIHSFSVTINSPILFISKDIFKINIYGSTFINCTLFDHSKYEESAAVILIDSPLSILKLDTCNFQNIIASSRYNVLKLFLLESTIINTFFAYANYYDISNISFIFTNQIVTRGSFINCLSQILFIDSCEFKYSYGLYGGAIFYSQLNSLSNFTLNNSLFNNIYSLSDGGVIYVNNPNNNKKLYIKIINSIFNFVGSFGFGGILYSKMLNSTYAEINNVTIERFFAIEGSIVYGEQINIKFNKCIISYNFKVFENNNLIFFQTYFENFDEIIKVGTLFKFSKSNIIFISVNIKNIFSSSELDSGIILSCITCNIIDIDSIYYKIKFTFSVFYLKENCYFNSTNSVFYDNNYNIISNKYLYKEDYDKNQINIDTYGLLYIINSKFVLNKLIFEKNNCEFCINGIGLSLHYSAGILNNMIFLENSFKENGCIFITLSNDNQLNLIYLNNSIFFINIAKKSAGAIFTFKSRLLINFTGFYKNFALDKGGAILFTGDDQDYNSYSLDIENCIFDSNFANIGGSIYYFPISIKIKKNTTFINNKAKYFGNNLYSYPEYLCQYEIKSNSSVLNCSENSIEINDFRSGDILNHLNIYIFDEEKYPIIKNEILSSPILNVMLEDNSNSSFYSINGTKDIIPINLNDQGIFDINFFVIVGKPLSKITLSFSSPSIMTNSHTNNLKIVKPYKLKTIINFRQCLLGEYYMTSSNICYVCPNGTYSFNITEETCKKCLEGVDCLGGNKTIVKSGFWRDNLFSEYIIQCDKLGTACIGGFFEGNQLCSEGHIGAKCESCDLMGNYWKKSYSRTTDNRCIKCDQLVYNYLIIAIFSLFNFLSMALSVKGTMDSIKLILQIGFIRILTKYRLFRIVEKERNIYIKIYLSYLQIIQVLTTINLTYPNWIGSMQVTVGNPTKSALYSFDCLISIFSPTKIPYIYIKLIIVLIIPFIYFSIFTIAYIIIVYDSKFKRKYSMLYCACLFTMIYFQPSIVESIVSILTCTKIGDKSYIRADLAFKCDDYNYYLFSLPLGIPALLAWVFVVPGIILWRMIVNRNKLNTIVNKIRYGYLYQEYNIYFWEFIKMNEKIFISLALAFYESEINIKILLILFVLVTYLFLLMKFSPYKKEKMNKVDQFNTSVCYISIFLGLLCHDNKFLYIISISYIIIIIINICFNIYIWKLIIQSFSYKFKHIKQVLKKKIYNLIPFLKKFDKFKINSNAIKKWNRARQLIGKYLREREKENISDFVMEKEKNKRKLFSEDSKKLIKMSISEEKNLESQNEIPDEKIDKALEKNNEINVIESIIREETKINEFTTKNNTLFTERNERTKEETNLLLESPKIPSYSEN